jgi:hypothetical protein
MTTFHPSPGLAVLVRAASRKRRFRRLRITLPPSALGTANPTLPCSVPAVRRQIPEKNGPDIRKPRSYTFWKSARRRNRALRGKDQSDFAPWIGLLGVTNGSFGADGQLLTAPRPAARQHGPAVFGLHTHPESVGLRAFPIVRLECAFWHLRVQPRAGALRFPQAPRQDFPFDLNFQV